MSAIGTSYQPPRFILAHKIAEAYTKTTMALTSTDLDQIREVVFEGMQATVEALNPRFEALEEGQARIEKRLDSIEGQLRDIEGRISTLEQRFDTLEGKVEALEADIKELYVMIQRAPVITNKQELKEHAQKIILDAHAQLKSLAKQAGVQLK